MLSFENICFLKVGNVVISFKLSSREFHSLVDIMIITPGSAILEF